MAFAIWQAAARCVGSARPGARALMKWSLGAHPGARSMGIYCCRTVRGGRETSCHAEGRACDVGFPLVGGKANPDGYDLVHALRGHAKQMGIQAIIFNRTIWSAKSPGRAGRPYAGVNPHLDHVHIELTRPAAERLNVATIRHWTSIPDPTAPLVYGDHGDAVAALQRALGVKPDGVFGRHTEAAVNELKAKHGLPRDGVAGPRVRALLAAEKRTP